MFGYVTVVFTFSVRVAGTIRPLVAALRHGFIEGGAVFWTAA